MFAGCVAVRSDDLCGVWRFSESNEPRLLQVVNTKEVATCVSVRLVIIRTERGFQAPSAAMRKGHRKEVKVLNERPLCCVLSVLMF